MAMGQSAEIQNRPPTLVTIVTDQTAIVRGI